MQRERSCAADVIVIGAGPTGLACAIDVQQAGHRVIVVDKGCLCNSLFHYPSHMTFFTTSELLEIGNIPFPTPHAKPSRNEALEYYRKVAMHYRLDVRQYETIVSVSGVDGDFRVVTADRFQREKTYSARKMVVATGYYDIPRQKGLLRRERAAPYAPAVPNAPRAAAKAQTRTERSVPASQAPLRAGRAQSVAIPSATMMWNDGRCSSYSAPPLIPADASAGGNFW